MWIVNGFSNLIGITSGVVKGVDAINKGTDKVAEVCFKACDTIKDIPNQIKEARIKQQNDTVKKKYNERVDSIRKKYPTLNKK